MADMADTISTSPNKAVGQSAEPSKGRPKDQPRDARATVTRHWDDAPVRTKLGLLVVLAVVLGAISGAVMVRTNDHGLRLSIMLSTSMVAVLWLAFTWLVRPLDRLVELVERLERSRDLGSASGSALGGLDVDESNRRPSPNELPMSRADELGRLARSMHRVYIAAARQRQENGQLRRTLDHRIEAATRHATVRLRQIAMRDALTDLGNRRFFDEHFPELFDTCRDAADDLACVLLDMDNFKQVNDTLGHAEGDELLVFLAGLIRACVRTEDYAVRFGGDEFVILMPGCSAKRVGEFTEQLRALFRQHVRIALPPALHADLSIGVAMLSRQHVTEAGDLLAHADTALYAAKRAGKGQTVGVQWPVPPAA